MNMNIKYFLTAFLASAALAVSACKDDDPVPVEPEVKDNAVISIYAQKASSFDVTASRANGTDANATEGEMMKSWVIIAVQNGVIEKILQPATAITGEKEIDEVSAHLEQGSTTFYSFANLTLADIGLENAKEGDALPADFEGTTMSISGNQLLASDFPNGIPMSGRQELIIGAETNEISLEVVRMVAKMEIQLYNLSDSNFVVKGITFTDITDNAATGTSNLYLLPKASSDDASACDPNLTSTATRSSFKYEVPQAQQTVVPSKDAPAQTLTFYVNESQAVDPVHFVMTLDLALTDKDGTELSDTSRYAVLSWDKIARNDLCVIPVKLGDYKLDMTPQLFTAIGVLAPVIKDDGTVLDLTFPWYGEFHIIPSVKVWSDGSEFNGTLSFDDSDCWSIIGGTNPANLFAVEPRWVGNTNPKRIEGYIAPYDGVSALYRLKGTITKEDGSTQTLTRIVRFRMKMSTDWM